MARPILLVEDDEAIAMVITQALTDDGFAVTRCPSIAERDAHLSAQNFLVMISDVRLTDGDGLETLEAVRAVAPDMPIIILSAQNSLDTAVRASDHGVFEYLPKPFDLDELMQSVERACGNRTAAASPAVDAIEDDGALPLVGRSAAMQRVYRMITMVLRNDLSVLVTGESGTGKELVAEAIHQLGNRSTGPFIAVNAAAIPRELIESELFGHEKGAFTGAVAQAIGKFEQANGGTLFLDEIGDMPADAQTRLLRALQSGRIRRVGGRQEIAVDVRIIAATNRDLGAMIDEGLFREDLFYRLNVIPIHLPALRQRREDIGALSQHFIVQAAEEGLPTKQLSESAITLLEKFAWRGNVRELRNAVFRLAVMARGDVIDDAAVQDLLGLPTESDSAGALPTAVDFAATVNQWLAEASPAPGTIHAEARAAMEKPLIERVLQETSGNQVRTAEMLGINRNTLRKRIKELGIETDLG